MANAFVYKSNIPDNYPMFGRFEHPIKALIEEEYSRLSQAKSELDILFNIEKSNRYSETVMGESDFATFATKEEGEDAAYDTVGKTFEKTIYHVEFAKEFEITRKAADDAKFGIGAEIKAKPRKMVRAYYKTRVDFAVKALINAKAANMTYSKSTVDLTTGDRLPLFHKAHPYALDTMTGTQSNLFYGDISSSEGQLEIALNTLANKVRNFKSESGEPMGYVANVLIIPGNRPKLEMMAKRICGSELNPSTPNNAINTQYGNWNLVVLSEWISDVDEIMVMSSEANENLLGNMFYDRTPLDIVSDINKHNRNAFWNAYARIGVGFNTWKHIARCTHSTTEVENATDLFA